MYIKLGCLPSSTIICFADGAERIQDEQPLADKSRNGASVKALGGGISPATGKATR